MRRWTEYQDPKSLWKQKVRKFAETFGLRAAMKKFKVGVPRLAEWFPELPEVAGQNVNKEVGELCGACGESIESDETLSEHMVVHHITEEGKCDLCGERIGEEGSEEHFFTHQTAVPAILDSDSRSVTSPSPERRSPSQEEEAEEVSAVDQVEECLDFFYSSA